MGTGSDSAPINRALFWIIALSLLTIAACFVVMMVRLAEFEPANPLQVRPSVVEFSLPPTNRQRTLPARERRSAARHEYPVAAETMPGVGVERISLAEPPPAQEFEFVSPTFISAGSVIVTSVPSGGLTVSNAGIISGKVTLRGTPPPEMPIDLSGQPYCANAQDAPLTTRHFVVDTNGGLADVLVYIRHGLSERQIAGPLSTNELQFINCQIQPYVSAVWINQALVVRNSDGTLHRALISTVHRHGFESGPLTNGATSVPVFFKQPDLADFARVRCELHPWETACVRVMATPFFAVTSENGRYSISNVPPGSYVLEAIHRSTHGTNGIRQPVRVGPGQVATVDFDVPAPTRRDSLSFR